MPKKSRISKDGIMYWSPTKLSLFLECARRDFFNWAQNKNFTTVPLAVGTHIHKKSSELILNPLRDKSRYNSAKSYANVIANDWQRGAIKEGKIRGDIILWDWEVQKWRERERKKGSTEEEINRINENTIKYSAKARIKEIALRTYPIITEERPILFDSNTKLGKSVSHNFKFALRGRGFKGEIDEILPGRVIRDFKTGLWGGIESMLEYNPQPTFYTLAFIYLSAVDPKFRKINEVADEEAKYWLDELNAGRFPRNHGVIFEYFMLEKKKEFRNGELIELNIDPKIRITRTEFQYKELCEKIDEANHRFSMMELTNSYPASRGWHCKSCFYQEECNKMTKGLENMQMPLFATNVYSFTPGANYQGQEVQKHVQETFSFLEKKVKTKKNK